MSPQASRIEPLRQQRAGLQHLVDHWPQHLARCCARKKKTRQDLVIVTSILRELAGLLIAGAY
jgi:hypothetical protein